MTAGTARRRILLFYRVSGERIFYQVQIILSKITGFISFTKIYMLN